MKRIFFMLLFCSTLCAGLMAQSTRVITGAVIDKNGNPLPGALVEATGGAESAVVDADGTFSIEVPIWLKSLTAKYTGFKDKKMIIDSSDLLFEMKKIHAFIPKNESVWFTNLVVSYTVNGEIDLEGADAMRVGVMAGYLGKWGGYIKLMPSLDEECRGIPAVTVGVTKRIIDQLHIYAGVGYAPVRWGCDDRYGDYCNDYSKHDEYYDDNSYEIHRYNGYMFDFGFIIRPSERFNLNIGCSCSTTFRRLEIDEWWNDKTPRSIDEIEPHIGLGYCF